MSYLLQLVEALPIPVAVIRARLVPRDLPRFVPSACGEVWSFIRATGLPRPGRHVAIYSEAEGWVEAGAEVGSPFPGNDRVRCGSLPAGHAVSTSHLGPYQQLRAAHGAIREWCAVHHETPTGISWEVYDHWQEDWNHDPSRIRTEVYHLLKTPPPSPHLR